MAKYYAATNKAGKYIKISPVTGQLCIFETEESAQKLLDELSTYAQEDISKDIMLVDITRADEMNKIRGVFSK